MNWIHVRREGDTLVLAANGSRIPLHLAPEIPESWLEYEVLYMQHPQGEYIAYRGAGSMQVYHAGTRRYHPACFLNPQLPHGVRMTRLTRVLKER